MRRLGGTPRVWRTDRLATVIMPGTRDVQASFAPVAKHYGAVVEPCPPRRGNRKGAVESSVRFVSGRWWRTMGATNPEDAQRSLDVFCATIGDERERRGRTVNAPRSVRWPTPSRSSPCRRRRSRPRPRSSVSSPTTPASPFAATATRCRRDSAGTTLLVRQRLSSPTIDVVAPSGAILVTHRLAPAGSGRPGAQPRAPRGPRGRRAGAFTTARPCDKKANRPPGKEALEEAAGSSGPIGREPVVDLSVYAEIVERR